MDSKAVLRRDGWEVCDIADENPAFLRTGLAATALVGVVPLPGGAAVVCRHLSPLAWGVVSGRKPRSVGGPVMAASWRRNSVGSIVGGDLA